MTAEETMKIGALLVPSTGLHSVALAALGLENLSTLGDVSHVYRAERTRAVGGTEVRERR